MQWNGPMLLCFSHRFLEFREAEMSALMELFNIKWKVHHNMQSPYLIVNGSLEEAIKFASRSVLLRCCCTLIAHNGGYPELYHKIQSNLKLHSNFINWSDSFKISVESFGKKLTADYKLQRIRELEFLPLTGQANLKCPINEFCIFEDYGSTPNKPPEKPKKVYFGKLVATGQCRIPANYTLKTRLFIGNTSMDPFLSFLMANIAKLQPNDIVYDPFVGTGSILLPCAHFGAYCLGVEIDYNVAHGRGKPSRHEAPCRLPEESVEMNFKQYGLQSRFLGIMVGDSSVLKFQRSLYLDAIVTDPPYGLREKARRLGMAKCTNKAQSSEGPNYPTKVRYALSDVTLDLLNFAADHLKIGGRLVYWLPLQLSKNGSYDDSILPHHPCMAEVSRSLQTLSKVHGRLLVTLMKERHPKLDGSDTAYALNDSQNDFRSSILGGAES